MKRTIKFNEDLSIESILKDYELEIYNSILNSIKENFRECEKSEINVVNISMQTLNYTVNLPRNKVVKWLNTCISFYEKLEEYEKCQECVDIIDEIQNNKTKKEPIEKWQDLKN